LRACKAQQPFARVGHIFYPKIPEKQMCRSILVPLDGSPFGEQALPLALSIARRTGARLEVVHVFETLTPNLGLPIRGTSCTWDSEIRNYRQTYLDSVVKRIASQTTVAVTSAFLDGSVVETLLNRLKVQGIDLVVMSTHGHGPLARFWLGSVADELLRWSPVPMLLVRPRQENPDFSGEPALRKVLIPLDGTPLAEKILDQATGLASSMQAEVLLLRVIQPMRPGMPEPTSGNIPSAVFEKLEAVIQERRREAAAYLDKIAQTLRSSSRTVRTCVVSHHQPAVAILSKARAEGVDLIAIETHGREGLGRLLLGSVADKVIRGASIPVLVHRRANEPAAVETPQ
jgi:nucleotide-binding universal stress UspA family protein